MGGIIRPGDDLLIARVGTVQLELSPGRLSNYGRQLVRLAEAGECPDGVVPAARFLMGLELASKSDYLENKILDHNLGKSSFTMPTNVYLALCTEAPTDAKTGTTIVEAGYTGYARKQVKAENLNAAASGQSTNSAELQFAACTASSSTIVGWALCDASTVGNMLYWGTATSTVISTTQTPATIAVGGLVVNED